MNGPITRRIASPIASPTPGATADRMAGSAVDDPVLPGLAAALRGDIVPSLSAALGAASSGAWSVRDARPVRYRYRPGKRAIVQYGLALAGPHGEQDAEAALWFLAGGKAAKLARKANGNGGNGTSPPPVALDPVTGGLLQIFPHDHRVPQVAAFLRDPGAHAEALAPGAEGAPQLVRFRPGIGATFRWRCAGGIDAYIKIHPGKNCAAAASQGEALRHAAIRAGFATPRVIGASDELSAIAIEGVEGRDFVTVLSAGRVPDIQAVSQRVARALAALHACGAEIGRQVDRGALVRTAASTALAIGGLDAGFGTDARRLADWIAATSAPLRSGPAHMDLKPEHIIVTDGVIVLLDLDDAARSDGLYDLAMLEMRLHSAWASDRCDPEQARAAIVALYGAYPRGDGHCMPPQLGWLRACAALQVAKHHVQNPSPGWCASVARVLEAGQPDGWTACHAEWRYA